MNKLLLSALAFALVVGGSACIFVVDDAGMSAHAAWDDNWDGNWNSGTQHGSGVEATQTRDVADFHAIQLRGSANVRVQVGEPKSVTVHCDDNLIDKVETRVEDGVLVIGFAPGSYRPRTDLVIEVGMPALDALDIRGSGDAHVRGLNGGNLRIGVSGSGDVVASGTVDTLGASISGSGDLSLYGLTARTANASIAGSGDIQVTVTEELSADIAGSGDVSYHGQPHVTRSIAGSGTVSRD